MTAQISAVLRDLATACALIAAAVTVPYVVLYVLVLGWAAGFAVGQWERT